jgi:putative DNA primase/helicase
MENQANLALQAAQDYMNRGWMPLPIPHRSKNPGFDNWQMFKTTPDELPVHFEQEKNIGVLLGKPSGWLVDIDLDHPRAIELADTMLPPTPAVFGRPGKPRSHRLYYITTPAATKKWRSKSEGMIIEFRSTGAQTVFPPSIHEEGEPITWETPGAKPAMVDTDVLFNAVQQVGEQVKVELGEKQPPKSKAKKRTSVPAEILTEDEMPADDSQKRYHACLESLNRLGIVDKRDGSFRLYVCACRCVGFDLDDDQAIRCIRDYACQKPFPKDYSDEQILKRIRDAEKNVVRGEALKTTNDGLIKLGGFDPDSGKIILSPSRTLPTAKAYVQQFHAHPDGRTLASYAGLMMAWCNNKYTEIEDGAVRNTLQPWLHDALRYVYNKTTRQHELVDFESNPGTVNSALESIRTYVHIPATTTLPNWLIHDTNLPNPKELLPCRTMNLHIPTEKIYPATPRLFTTSALEFDYDANAPEPVNWLTFLDALWEEDTESIELLQDWFGYCLTADTSQQKMLLMVGPRRCGKGTIGRILTKLIGPGNVCGPTTGSLAGTFGLQPLIGKSLAIISDARFTGQDIGTVVERLLCISGEDALTIDRKHKESVTMKLPTRFMCLTNELPRLNDASNALTGRFMLLKITKSWFGQEDHGLEGRLTQELPGILLWALQGWARLRQRGKFIQPAASLDAIEELEDLCSPVAAFVRERCWIGSMYRAYIDDLYSAWQAWCAAEGRSLVSTKQTFGRDLKAVVPGIKGHQNHSVNGGRYYDGIGLAH